MSEPIAVSVICNTFNHEKYIRDALDGFLMQKTSFSFEILIHDDASTDHTADIIREYEKRNPDLIKPIYELENQYHKKDGTIKRLQANRAKGKYIAFCEGDDYWIDPRKLQKQYDFMESHPDYSLCACSTQWLNMLNGKIEKRTVVKEDTDITLEDLILLKGGRIFPTVSVFMKVDPWKTIPSWGFPVGDIPLAIYAAMNGKVRMLSDTMCVYRWYAEGSWTMRQGRSVDEKIKAHSKMIAGFEAMNRETDYKYDEIIHQRILVYQYAIAKFKHDFRALTNGELGEKYRKRSFYSRFIDRLCCQAPGLFYMLQKIAGHKE